ncbi:hypothetical protein AAC387_Pa07g3903 [Persea americana]
MVAVPVIPLQTQVQKTNDFLISLKSSCDLILANCGVRFLHFFEPIHSTKAESIGSESDEKPCHIPIPTWPLSWIIPSMISITFSAHFVFSFLTALHTRFYTSNMAWLTELDIKQSVGAESAFNY